MEKKNVRIIVIVVLAAILIGVVAYGVNKYVERKNAEKLLNQVFDMQNQMITQGTDMAENIFNGALNVYNDIEQEKKVEEQQKVEEFKNEQQEMVQDIENKQEEILQDVQNKQQEMIQNGGSSQQQQMLQDVQSMQQQMLQMMQ